MSRPTKHRRHGMKILSGVVIHHPVHTVDDGNQYRLGVDGIRPEGGVMQFAIRAT